MFATFTSWLWVKIGGTRFSMPQIFRPLASQGLNGEWEKFVIEYNKELFLIPHAFLLL